jgi:hypothetical protein
LLGRKGEELQFLFTPSAKATANSTVKQARASATAKAIIADLSSLGSRISADADRQFTNETPRSTRSLGCASFLHQFHGVVARLDVIRQAFAEAGIGYASVLDNAASRSNLKANNHRSTSLRSAELWAEVTFERDVSERGSRRFVFNVMPNRLLATRISISGFTSKGDRSFR